jgi:broad specificity phosphatase PhoE
VELWLARHGETEWSLSKQHTGSTDIPLTPNGEEQARALGSRLRGVEFTRVISSPLQRARHTAELAGLGDRVEIDEDFVEVDYGEYEGITTAEIRETRPDWELWRDGSPGGETPAKVGARADRVVERIGRGDGRTVVFGHGHMSRALSARWLGFPVEAARNLVLQTATLSVIGVEHGHPAIVLWNDASHLREAGTALD